MSKTHSESHLQEAREIIDAIDFAIGSRLFFLGVGGCAGQGHAVNDFRRIAGIVHTLGSSDLPFMAGQG